MWYKNVLELIGNTPLVKINTLHSNKKVTLLAKLEYLNPGGSIKDRIGLAMIQHAIHENKLKKGTTIIEPTSGNTGVGLAMASALFGFKTIFVMPDKMSEEKINLLKAYGSKVVITPTNVKPNDKRSYYSVSNRLAKEIKNSYKPNQYSNPINPQTHYKTTGPEIWSQTRGKITHLVCGIGTGGTITGIAKYLKEKNPNIKIIGVDPVGSVFKSYFKTRKFIKVKSYKVEGVGEDFIPKTVNFSYIDQLITVSDKNSFLTTRQIARREGILVGGSSGLALFAAKQVIKKVKTKAIIVVIFPDSGKSYLSKIFNDQWMKHYKFL